MFLLLLLTCNGAEKQPIYPDATTYDQACTAATDCTIVLASDCSCSCDWVALSLTGATAFEADVNAYWTQSEEGCTLGCDPYCGDPTTDCVDGQCVLVPEDTGN